VADAIRSIVERSSTLWERLSGPFVSTGDADELCAFRLQQWIDTLPPGTFEERLAHDGLPIDAVISALGPVRLPDDQPLPAWTDTLKMLIQAASYVPHPAIGVPFAEVLTSAVAATAERLRHDAGDASDALTSHAWRQMETHLMTGLSNLLTPAFASSLNLARRLRRLQGASPEERYQRFLERTLGAPGSRKTQTLV